MATMERIVDIFEDSQGRTLMNDFTVLQIVDLFEAGGVITFREASKLVRERMQEAHERKTRLTEEDFGAIERTHEGE